MKTQEFFQSASGVRTVLAVTFVLFLLLTALTPYLADDYYYMYSIATGEPFSKLAMLFPSMLEHARLVNGRLVSHSLVQGLLLFPKTVFNLCNAAVFAWLTFACYSVCNYGKKPNVFLLAGIEMALWLGTPGFGESYFWYAGAINYLWALAFCMVFLRPYFAVFFDAGKTGFLKPPRSPLGRSCFCLIAFLFGAYSEIASFVGLAAAIGLLALSDTRRKTENRWLWLPIFFCAVGYLCMLRMPAEAAKSGGFALGRLFFQVPRKTAMLRDFFKVPISIWAVLMVFSQKAGVKRSSQVLSLGLFLCAILGNYILVAASYVVRRCLCVTAFFVVFACAVLLGEMWDHEAAPVCRALLGVVAALFVMSFTIGAFDIGSVFLQARARRSRIEEQLSAGKAVVYVEDLKASTPYSAAYALEQLDRENSDVWPNCYLARYFGAEQLLGTDGETPAVLLQPD